MSNLREKLLTIMDRKTHWGWENFTKPGLSKQQFLIHFQQEYETFVRDFPLFLARVLGRIDGENLLKRDLAENIYEEQTGGMSRKYSGGLSHPDLFLKMMSGFGYSKKSFEKIPLLPTSLAYRCFLENVTFLEPWPVAAGIVTIFVEGSVEDRVKIKSSYRNSSTLKSKLNQHPLIRFYGLKEKDADLIKVHHAVESGHRKSAWEVLLKIVPSELETRFIQRMEEALELWQLYRDGICLEMGLEIPHYSKLI